MFCWQWRYIFPQMIFQASSGSPESAVFTFCVTEKSHPGYQGMDRESFAPVQESCLLTDLFFVYCSRRGIKVLSCMTEHVLNFDSYSTSKAYSAAGADLRPLLHVIPKAGMKSALEKSQCSIFSEGCSVGHCIFFFFTTTRCLHVMVLEMQRTRPHVRWEKVIKRGNDY